MSEIRDTVGERMALKAEVRGLRAKNIAKLGYTVRLVFLCPVVYLLHMRFIISAFNKPAELKYLFIRT